MEKKTEEGVKRLMEAVFAKARKDSGKNNAFGLCHYLHEEGEVSIGERNLTRYYKYYIEGVSGQDIIPDAGSLDILSRYLNYSNFKAFKDQLREEADSWKRKYEEERIRCLRLRSSYGIYLILLSAGLLIFMLKHFEQNCMVWTGAQYEKTRCTGSQEEIALDDRILMKFQKVSLTDTTTFFKASKPLLWYDKSGDTLEFFSGPGIHPSNGKTLKPVTEYMIDKYVRRISEGGSQEKE